MPRTHVLEFIFHLPSTGKMALFADIVGDEASAEDFNSMALHFEAEKNSLQAGRFFFKAGHHSKAVKQLMKVIVSNSGGGEDSEALNLAIEVVGQSGDPHLSRQLIDYLIGT
jgi:WD repeat-containing protein 19